MKAQINEPLTNFTNTKKLLKVDLIIIISYKYLTSFEGTF